MNDNQTNYELILKEIEKIQNDQLMNDEKYYEIYGPPEDYDDVISKNLYFQDIDFNLDWRFKNLFYKILYFLDSEKLEGLLNTFNNDFKERMFSHDKIRDTEYIDEYDIDVPALISDIRTFFYSMYDFYIPNNENSKNKEIEILERILRNAEFALKDEIIKKEKNFYDPLVKIIRITFPTTQKNPKGQYIKKFKSYIPDIFVPQCNSLIELKFADSKEKLVECMEQIDTDEKGYTNNPNYNNYYAVFYLTELFATRDELNELWKERKHPYNWKPFFLVGSQNMKAETEKEKEERKNKKKIKNENKSSLS